MIKETPENQFSGVALHHQDGEYMWYEIKGRMYPVFNQYGTTKNVGAMMTTKLTNLDSESEPHKAGTDTES